MKLAFSYEGNELLFGEKNMDEKLKLENFILRINSNQLLRNPMEFFLLLEANKNSSVESQLTRLNFIVRKTSLDKINHKISKM